MHPALKLFCILWLFMGAMAAAVGFKQGVPQYGVIGVVLTIFSISGIVGFRAAPTALMIFWLSMLLSYLVQFVAGGTGGFTRVLLPSLMFIGFAFISFLIGQPPPTEETPSDGEAEPQESGPTEESD